MLRLHGQQGDVTVEVEAFMPEPVHEGSEVMLDSVYTFHRQSKTG